MAPVVASTAGAETVEDFVASAKRQTSVPHIALTKDAKEISGEYV